jgi:AraC-like DNA-binding protein
MTLSFLVAMVLKCLLIAAGFWFLGLRPKEGGVKQERAPAKKGSPDLKRHPYLSKNQLNDYQRRIEAYLRSETSYLDIDFRMRTMVEETGIPRHHLSAVINTVYQTNFNQLINQHRIEYLLKRFHEPKWARLTFEGMAREVGFRNRSTFLSSFKKVTGMTPSQFRKRNRKKRDSEASGPGGRNFAGASA